MNPDSPVSAIIVAAGKGVRMSASCRKQYLHLAGEPIIIRTLRRFNDSPAIDNLFLVAPPTELTYCRQLIEQSAGVSKLRSIVPGGDSRQASVYQGLLAVESRVGDSGIVAVHDGVRPLVSPETIDLCVSTARKEGACIPAIQANETIKLMTPDTGTIIRTLSRDDIWFAQTPQTFQYRIIRDAHEHALRNGIIATDDAMLVEALHLPVKVISGSRQNIKITTPEDIAVAEAFLKITESCRQTGLRQ